MNICQKTHLEQRICEVIVFLVSINLSLISSCARQEARVPQKKPPRPKTPVSTLRMPKPIRFQEIKGRATLPEQLKWGFALDLAGKIVPGKWDITGKVTAIEGRTATIVSDKGEIGHFVYRLPKGLRPSLSRGQPISLQRTLHGHGAALGSNLLVSSSERLLVASGRLFGSSPQKLKIWEGLSLEQSQGRQRTISESKYETMYEVPVTLTVNGVSTRLTIGKLTEIVLQRKPYLVLLLRSNELVPTKEYEGVAEGQGYVLEYVTTPK